MRGWIRPLPGELTLASLAAVASALWIAICGAAPEFIWQGARLVIDHAGRTELLAGLLIGLVLAFFVEPVMERLRFRLRGGGHDPVVPAPRNALFTTAVSLAFALVSVCLHDAIATYVSGRGAHDGNGGLEAGLRLAAEWAFVPFAVTLAWLTAGPSWLRVCMGALAAASSGLAALLFGWTRLSALTTTIPCVAILALGYWQLRRGPTQLNFVRCARVVALVGASWLVVAALIEAGSGLSRFGRIEVYPAGFFWEDLRFYAGWAIGLTLAPWPFAGRDEA